MALESRINPHTGNLQLIVDEDSLAIITFKEGVPNVAALPLTNNTKNDGRFTANDGHLHIWTGAAWIDQGDVLDLDWGGITGTLSNQTDLQNALNAKQDDLTNTDAEIQDVVLKKHTQNKDTKLDEGGANEISASELISINNIKRNIDLSAQPNGITLVFTTPDNYVADTLSVYLGGMRLTPGVGKDYQETGINQFTINSIPPVTNEPLLVDYIKL